jgi:sugar lactone lactonase YvrE
LRRWRWAALAGGLIAVAACVWLFLDKPTSSRPPAPMREALRRRWPVGVRTVAGSGSPGFADGAWWNARFSDPFGVAVDGRGNVFVSDAGDNDAIRRVAPDGRVALFCGGREGFDDGDAAAATFRAPSGLAILPDGRLVVADTGNNAIRLVGLDGRVTTLAGDGTAGREDGTGRAARFNGPIGVAVAPDGAVFVADTYNDAIRRVAPDGRVSTAAGGGGTGYRDGTPAEALFDTPSGVAVTRDGDVFVADTGNNVIRRISAGQVSTLDAAPDAIDYHGWMHPAGVAVSGPFLYVTDANRVSVIDPDGRVVALAGSTAGAANGPGDDARFCGPTGIAVDAAGTAWVADSDNYLVRRLSPPGTANPPVDIDLVRAPVLTPASLQIASLPWPVDGQHEWHELAATLGEARGSRGGDGRERLHSGIDVKGDVGAIVRAVRDEVVRRPVSAGPFDAINESLRVGVLFYVHIRVGRTRRGTVIDEGRFRIVRDPDGHALRVRVKRGTRFRVGDPIGTINRQAHVHLNVGPYGAEVNPLAFALPEFADTEPPVIVPNGVSIYDDAYDRVNGNAPYRRLGVYAIGYQVLDARFSPAPGFEAPLETIEFDRLPPDAGAPALVYADRSGITAYGSRTTRFRYIVTDIVRHGDAAAGRWDATALPPGDYVVRVTARDLAGNATTQDLAVSVQPGTR